MTRILQDTDLQLALDDTRKPNIPGETLNAYTNEVLNNSAFEDEHKNDNGLKRRLQVLIKTRLWQLND